MLVLQASDINALAVSELSLVGPGFFCAVVVRVKFEYAMEIGINAAGGNSAHATDEG
jgi:hypothetical protein